MEKMLSVREVAEFYNITQRTVINWIKSGRLKAIKVESRWRMDKEEVMKLRDKGE